MQENLINLFGCRVFNDNIMRQKLPKKAYESLKRTIVEGLPLEQDLAEIVANAMKDWAIEEGATHFTHWFQPMTNMTAGKHDSFISPTADGRIILEFSGKELAKGEPDASSFPSGGLRVTFEARGYTTWDPSSPAFIKDGTLYIPTAFCSYTGESLDKKTPLLKSIQAVSKEAIRILKLFGNTTSRRVIPTVGAEQEYFLIDRDLYENRLDLKICGRTLFGAKPPKGQQMDDHYCGRIKIRVADFMQQLDQELWSMGVMSKTKHNEAAPAQHELAPVFESANLACDHNQLTMETLRTVAKKKNLACLLHEKPFSGVNGSGKHNNWSLSTDDGINLLDPGKTPWENVQFLVFLCAVITAVDKYPELLRLSAASAGNDHRLGACEAPPAIISIFLGEALTNLLFDIANGVSPRLQTAELFKTGVAILPTLPKDSSDRNRTSPFAFTGNKFEFRMVGASQSVASSNYMLNAAVAEVLNDFANRIETAPDFDTEIKNIVSDTVHKHGRIIFNGNNYSQDWVEEAAKRGLPNLPHTLAALDAFLQEKNLALLEKTGVFTRVECKARYEIQLENYVKTVSIEADTMMLMANRQILPSAISYIGSVATAANAIKSAGVNSTASDELLNELTTILTSVKENMNKLNNIITQVRSEECLYQKAQRLRNTVLPQMAKLRESCDKLEQHMPYNTWPIPSYVDLLHKI